MGDEGKAAGRVPLAALPSLWCITATSRMPPDVRFGSKADITAVLIDVRFTHKSGHWNSGV